MCCCRAAVGPTVGFAVVGGGSGVFCWGLAVAVAVEFAVGLAAGSPIIIELIKIIIIILQRPLPFFFS